MADHNGFHKNKTSTASIDEEWPHPELSIFAEDFDSIKKKVVCIGCFDPNEAQIKPIRTFFESKNHKAYYLTSDFNHQTKRKETININTTIQIPVLRYKKNLSLRRILSHYLFSLRLYLVLCRIKPDIILAQIPPNSVASVVAYYKSKYKCKLIFYVFDVWPESFPYDKFKLLLKIPFVIWKKMRNNSLLYADYIFFVSKSGLQKLENYLSGQKTAILFPSKCEKYEIEYLPMDIMTINICYLGSINHIIDIDLIVSFLKRVNRNREVVLHVIGDGENRNVLIASVEALGIKVMFHGIIFDWSLKKDIFCQCSFGINMYKSIAQLSMTLKSVDYLCAGLPLLSNIAGDTSYLVEKYKIGFNVKKENIENVAQLIEGMQPHELNAMRLRCRKVYNEYFSEQAYNTALEECFYQIGL